MSKKLTPEQARQNALESKRKYYYKNRDKALAYAKGYYKENKDKLLEQSKGWRDSHPEKVKEYNENIQYAMLNIGRSQATHHHHAGDDTFGVFQWCFYELRIWYH